MESFAHSNGKRFDYGPTLSDDEYQRKIVELHATEGRRTECLSAQELRHEELELDINHKLGRDFPRDRRQALWEIVQRVEERRGRLLWISLLQRIVPFGFLPWRANALARYLADQYQGVLSREETEALLDVNSDNIPRFHDPSAK